MSQPKIAYVVSRFPLLSESFILRELDELEAQGAEVVLCPLLRQREDVVHASAERWVERAWYTPFVSWPLIRDSLWQVRRAPLRALSTVLGPLVVVARTPRFLLGTLGITLKVFHLARRLEEAGVVHVHAHYATHPAMAAWMVERLTGIGYSFTVHAHDLYVHTDMLSEKIRRARFVVTISEFNRRLLSRAGDPDKVHLVRCGVDLDRYPLQRDTPRGPFTILTVATLQEYKGLEYLVHACALLAARDVPDWRWLLVGSGELRGRLERLIADLGLRGPVQLLGPKPQDEVAELLQHAHVFVLPSVVARDGQMEGLPVALMEALAVGVPVIATDISGIPELVRPRVTGYLVPPRDPNALADAIESVIRDPEPARALARNGRTLVEAEFSLADNVRSLACLFSRVTRNGAAR